MSDCPTGVCGSHSYLNITPAKANAIISQLQASGATVTGDNPWTVETQSGGVELCGFWDNAAGTLTVTVTDKQWYVPCSRIWDTVDPLINHVQGLSEEAIDLILQGFQSGAITEPKGD